MREKGKKVEGAMLRKKSKPPADAPSQKKAPKQAPPKAKAPKQAPKPAKKVKPVKQAKPAPKAAPKPHVPKKKPAIVRQAAPKRKKVQKKPGINPITQQPYEKKSKSGYVEKGAVSLDNLKRQKLRGRRKKASEVTLADYGSGGW